MSLYRRQSDDAPLFVDYTDYQAVVAKVIKLEALLREGRGQSYGVMGIGTHKLIALKEWFAKVDAALGSTSDAAKEQP